MIRKYAFSPTLPAVLLAALACVQAGAQVAENPAPASETRLLIERGKALLGQYQCGACHAIPEVPIARGPVAQPLEAWGQRSYIAGRLPNTPAMLAQWIMAPQALVPGTAMPSMGVSAEDARAMAAFLFSLE